MTSSRSPWSPVAASVHLPAAPFPDSAPFSRTKRERPGVLLNVADQPVAALAASVREITAAHRLGVLRETARQFRRLLRHGGCPQTKRARRRRRALEGGVLLLWLFSRDRVGVGRDGFIFGRLLVLGHGRFAAV